ncbi:MAG TPA: deoxyribonuclease IV [Phycisphaerales bacterium]|nr:deoxyribonuclease IV [Phycisphaerales bacterium]
MLGSHLSISDGLSEAAWSAHRLGMDTVQVFTKNQRQWKVRPLDDGAIAAWRSAIAELGWAGRTVSHASYLINLASPDAALWQKSVDLMTEEIERCERLGIPFLVHHPGAATDGDVDRGLERIARAYEQVFRRTRGYATVSCLEDTVGSGSVLGRTFDELARLRAMIIASTGEEGRVGYCLDTCHAHAAGYDFAGRAAAETALAEFGRICGMEHLRVIHLNDSVGSLGSRKDRHAHIGEGTIGRGTTAKALGSSGFAAVMNHPRLKNVPKILETPKEASKAGTPMDAINLRRLRRLEPDAASGPKRAAGAL